MTIKVFSPRKCLRTIICTQMCFVIFNLAILFFFPASIPAQEQGAPPVTAQETPPATLQPTPALTPPPTAAEKMSWLEFLFKGGLTMVPIALCSIGFIAIIAAKHNIFRLMRFRINTFAEALTSDASSGRIDSAINLCDKYKNPITRSLKSGLEVYKTEPSRTADALRESMLDEIPGIEAYIGWLGIIAGVAPLLGLYGTVVGVIEAFMELAAGGAVTDPGSFKVLADGIYKALITTAAGLFVGIPALVMYEYFRMKVSDLVRDMDRVSVSLLNALGIGIGGNQ